MVTKRLGKDHDSTATRNLFAAGTQYTLDKIPVSPNLNALSVDVECWEHIIWRDLTNGRRAPCEACARLTESLLDLFREAGVKATFFVLGIFAQSFPELVRKMDAQGHEIASHGFLHRQLFKLTPREFEEDVFKVVTTLSDITGKPIVGYRAPSFSLDGRTPWALEILAKHGIQYDSSIFPFFGRRYGVPEFPRHVVRIRWRGGSIIEVPLSTLELAGKRFPVAGGGYFRLLPRWALRWAVGRVNRDGAPFVAYAHPYEFAAQRMEFGQFRPPMKSGMVWLQEMRFNLFRRTMKSKLMELLKSFRFAPIREVIKDGLEA
jgi:polysaccharide deacetylase family protein (PEP-CTERM system associated)